MQRQLSVVAVLALVASSLHLAAPAASAQTPNTDPDQAGSVTLSTSQPQVGAEVTATLSDPDGGVSGVSWQWEYANSKKSYWNRIEGADSASYTPAATLAGARLRARATYTDTHGPNKSSSSLDAAVAQATTALAAEVAADWALIPTNAESEPLFEPGDSFRLLFVTSTTAGGSEDYAGFYDGAVHDRAAANPSLAPHTELFRAVVSTAGVDARDHTMTTHSRADPGVPIFWVGGAKVADDYAGFYDGRWDSYEKRDESGSTSSVASVSTVWTGSTTQGVKYPDRYAGAVAPRISTSGIPIGVQPVTRAGEPQTGSDPLSHKDQYNSGTCCPLYGLSPVFTVAAAPVVELTVPSNPTGEVTLTVPDDAQGAPPGASVMLPQATATRLASQKVTITKMKAADWSGGRENPPANFRVGETVVEIEGVTLEPGETATVCLPAGPADTTLARYDEDTSAWVTLSNITTVTRGTKTLICGDTDSFSLFLTLAPLTKPTLVLSVAEIGEDGGSATVTATLESAAAAETTITVSAAAVSPTVAADFNQTGTTLTIASGATASTGTVTITAVNNDAYSGNRTITVSGVVSGNDALADPDDVTLTITEDDAIKPKILTATPGDESVTLVWENPGDSTITKYQYKQRGPTGRFGSWTTITPSDADTTSYTVTGLTNGTEYTFRIRVRNSVGWGPESNNKKATPSVQVTDDGTVAFTEGATAARSVPENTPKGIRVGTAVAATPPNEGDTLAYALAGADADAFTIDEHTGQLRFAAAPDFENPADKASTTPANAAANNEYVVVVTVTDAKDSEGNAEASPVVDDTITVTVTVTDVDERGRLALSATRPVVGTAVTAAVSDPDGSVTGKTWEWERSTGRTTWSTVSGATAASYTPTAADAGRFLRVTTFDGGDNQLRAITTEVVRARHALSKLEIATTSAKKMYPAFDAATLHYAVGCQAANSSTVAPLTVTLAAADAATRVAVNGVQRSSGETTFTLTPATVTDQIEITLSGATGAATTYVVHCLDNTIREIKTAKKAGATGIIEELMIFSAAPNVMVIDNNGVPRWYKDAPNAGPFFRYFERPDGTRAYFYSLPVKGTTGTLGSDWYELDDDFEHVDLISTVGSLKVTDTHDIILLDDGNYVVLSYEPADRDFSSLATKYGVKKKRGGSPQALFPGSSGYDQGLDLGTEGTDDGVIQVRTPNAEPKDKNKKGTAVWEWNSWGYLPIADCVQNPTPHNFPGDYQHINSVELLDDGDFIASFRGCSTVVRINRTPTPGEDGDGDVVWRLGRTNLTDAEWTALDDAGNGHGKAPLKILGDPHGEFCGQHAAYLLENGNLFVFDNGVGCVVDPRTGSEVRTSKLFSRVIEYALDPENGEAVFQRDHSLHGTDTYLGYFSGHQEELDNGDWLVSWGGLAPGLRTNRGLPDSALTPDHSTTQVDPDTKEEKFSITIGNQEHAVGDKRNSIEDIRAIPLSPVALSAKVLPLEAAIADSATNSAEHTGSADTPKVVVAFNQPVKDFAAATGSVTVTGATVASVAPHTAAGEAANAYVFTLAPTGSDDISFSLNTGAACGSAASSGVCTAAGAALSTVPAAHTITADIVNAAPEFDDGETATKEYPENGTGVVATYTATDDDVGDTLKYSLSGTDAADFNVDTGTGALSFKTAPDFEAPADDGENNVYEVTVGVTDGKNAAGAADTTVDDSIAVTVTVTNVNEPGTVSFDSEMPAVGTPLTASLADPDGEVVGETWVWTRLDTAAATLGTLLTEASSATYTPVAADAGKWLKAAVAYTDGHGGGKTAFATAAAVTAAAPLSCAGTVATPSGSSAGLVADCEALLAARNALAGTGSLDWATTTAVADWAGVTLAGGRVAELDLSEMSLTGTIPAGLGGLSALEYLDVSANELTGEIPAELGDLSALWHLDVSANELTGEIPVELGDLSALEYLDLSANALTGGVPEDLGDLSALWGLYLNDNMLAGAIPAELATGLGPRLVDGGWVLLSDLDLSGNKLTGEVALSVSPVSVSEGGGPKTVKVTAALDAGSAWAVGYGLDRGSVTVSVAGSGASGAVGFAAVADFDISLRGDGTGIGEFTLSPTADSGTVAETVSVTADGTVAMGIAVSTAAPAATVTIAEGAPANSGPRFATRVVTLNVNENAAAGAAVGEALSAADPNSDAVAYSLRGCDDLGFAVSHRHVCHHAALFGLDTSSGQLTVKAPLDYETNNRSSTTEPTAYVLTVDARDNKSAGGGADTAVDDTIMVIVNVVDVDEPGVIVLSTAAPAQGAEVTATVFDGDYGPNQLTTIHNIAYKWERLDTADATSGTTITTATGPGYTPTSDDAGKWLRVTVSYNDKHSPDPDSKTTATATTPNPVTGL